MCKRISITLRRNGPKNDVIETKLLQFERRKSTTMDVYQFFLFLESAKTRKMRICELDKLIIDLDSMRK